MAQYLGFAKASVGHGPRFLRQGGFLTRDADDYLDSTEVGRETAGKIYARHPQARREL